MAHIKKIHFNRVGQNEGCCCDKCGQYIRNIWTVEYTDGIKLNFGIDCFEKMTKEKLNAYSMKQMKAALKRIQNWSEQLQKWQSGEITEEDESWKNEQADWNKDSYWYGRSFNEYKDWMINEFIPYRLENAQKEFKKFQKINFNR
jgi:hypothetical protein